MFSIRLSLLFVAALPGNHVSNSRSQEASVPGADTIRVILLKIRTDNKHTLHVVCLILWHSPR